ncbi:putative oxidoreductase [Venturia nashicola]|uniref:Putative oxidoreductase n=1 Tax=Venturia nashicola TaxID=86259 RepID=A0A4Z1PPJ2_9PEZI|nr:putative oxidoreductase [Venturia nashicola]
MATKPLVLLTGATGFVGAHILSQLLDSDLAVLAPVRSESKTTFLKSKYPAHISSGSLTFIAIPDLSAPGALGTVLQGKNVEYIIHVASPFFVSAKDSIKELVEPAVEATKNILNAAIEHGQALKKVIILSSFAAVQNPFDEPRAGYIYTDKDWNPITPDQASTNGVLGYMASKTFAERAAWETFDDVKKMGKGAISWDLITFCPPMIYGPPLHEIDLTKGIGGLNTSLKFLLESVTAPGRVGTPFLPHWVDVRDVALAHAKAISLPKGTGGRFLLCEGPKYYEDGLAGLRKRGAKGLGEEGEKCDAGKWFCLDSSKAREVLGLEWRWFEACTEDVWAWGESAGLVGQQ